MDGRQIRVDDIKTLVGSCKMQQTQSQSVPMPADAARSLPHKFGTPPCPIDGHHGLVGYEFAALL